MKNTLPPGATSEERMIASMNDISSEMGERLQNLGLILHNLSMDLKSSMTSLTKTLDRSSASADKHSKAMFWLTVALVAATVVQALPTFLPFALRCLHL